jgi:hypothetical protein
MITCTLRKLANAAGRGGEFFLHFLEILPALIVIAVVVRFGTTSANGADDPLVAELGDGFVSGTAQVNGTSVHYVRGGRGRR